MFTLIQSADRSDTQDLMQATYRLRKKVFADQLYWDVPVTGNHEFDAYDTDAAQYLVWCSPDRQTLYGVVRLIATTKPTLLFDVFARTHGNDESLRDDAVMEGTRMCLDKELIARDFPTLSPAAGFTLLLLALCEAGLALGVRQDRHRPARVHAHARFRAAETTTGCGSGEFGRSLGAKAVKQGARWATRPCPPRNASWWLLALQPVDTDPFALFRDANRAHDHKQDRALGLLDKTLANDPDNTLARVVKACLIMQMSHDWDHAATRSRQSALLRQRPGCAASRPVRFGRFPSGVAPALPAPTAPVAQFVCAMAR